MKQIILYTVIFFVHVYLSSLDVLQRGWDTLTTVSFFLSDWKMSSKLYCVSVTSQASGRDRYSTENNIIMGSISANCQFVEMENAFFP